MSRLMRWCVPDIIAPTPWDRMILAFEEVGLHIWSSNYWTNRAIAANAVMYAHMEGMRNALESD